MYIYRFEVEALVNKSVTGNFYFFFDHGNFLTNIYRDSLLRVDNIVSFFKETTGIRSWSETKDHISNRFCYLLLHGLQCSIMTFLSIYNVDFDISVVYT